ncbi:carbon-nitrogen hydrolase family protein [Orrella sp. 11846]|uniref:carbon-nitrogen hydrolase family protein n=1 Tax=Orrella sp. 11846 TaxID=3409913 RepID=UPI003B5C0DC1
MNPNKKQLANEPNIYPKIKLASVQAEPVYMDTDKTIDKVCNLVKEASKNGANIIAFSESFVPGFPYWCRYVSQAESVHYTKQLLEQAILIPGNETAKLCQVARENNIAIVIGVTEKTPNAHGTLYNTNITIDNNGVIVGRHRKLMPTLGEKLVWAFGDGEGLLVHSTKFGKIGTLICGENANSLARFVLIAEGEQVHVANYPAVPKNDPGGYNMSKDIEIRSAAHSFEGKVFTMATSCVIGESTKNFYKDDETIFKFLESGGNGHTAIYGPLGTVIAGPLDNDIEDIVYADVNLEDALLTKLRHDIGGGYNRFDIMRVSVNRTSNQTITSFSDSSNKLQLDREHYDEKNS